MKRTICIILSLFLGGVAALAGQDGLGLNTVVIDAGHGGKDAGAVSKDKKSYEKTFTLDIAKRFAECIEKGLPELKVVLTRDKDEFIELRERAEIANRAHADLFISIHINSNFNTSPSGYSVHILGQSSQKDRDLFAYNMDVVIRENSVILLEDDYKTHYQGFDPSDPESYIFMQLMQNAYLEQSLLFATIVSKKLKDGPIKTDRGIDQNPFYVLWKTSMPAVLLELGFISNPADLATLKKADERQKIAERLFEALKDYKTLYDSSVKLGLESAKTESTTTVVQAEEQKQADPAKTAVLYGTQIFATSRRLDPEDKRLLGWKPQVIQIKSLYKYIIGISESPEEARKNYEQIKLSYPGCFMVVISDGETSRYN